MNNLSIIMWWEETLWVWWRNWQSVLLQANKLVQVNIYDTDSQIQILMALKVYYEV